MMRLNEGIALWVGLDAKRFRGSGRVAAWPYDQVADSASSKASTASVVRVIFL